MINVSGMKNISTLEGLVCCSRFPFTVGSCLNLVCSLSVVQKGLFAWGLKYLSLIKVIVFSTGICGWHLHTFNTREVSLSNLSVISGLWRWHTPWKDEITTSLKWSLSWIQHQIQPSNVICYPKDFYLLRVFCTLLTPISFQPLLQCVYLASVDRQPNSACLVSSLLLLRRVSWPGAGSWCTQPWANSATPGKQHLGQDPRSPSRTRSWCLHQASIKPRGLGL